MIINISEENIERNLIDIGCNQEQIIHFMEIYKKRDLKKMLNFLKCERLQILNEVHQEQKKIDYLDYLVYTLKKEVK